MAELGTTMPIREHDSGIAELRTFVGETLYFWRHPRERLKVGDVGNGLVLKERVKSLDTKLS